MPVHRVPGGKRGAVFAYSAEIEGWMVRQRPEAAEIAEDRPVTEGGSFEAGGSVNGGRKEEQSGVHIPGESTVGEGSREGTGKERGNKGSSLRADWRRGAISLLVIGLGAAVVAAVLHPMDRKSAEVVTVKYGSDTVEGVSVDGRTIWAHKYPKRFSRGYLESPIAQGIVRGFRIDDFFGDGQKEAAVVVPLQTDPNPSDPIILKSTSLRTQANSFGATFQTGRFGLGTMS